ncbi:hypothetical protein HanXRQr2_Chr09g0399331 [Helianthus annuus]|uniref:Uncharacterized protein n=1 Tax=Helianthus annuus TaxID=4232 RepID=A0A9K3I951_HELAN|nr:hypothetical protein HanXRQr2_Chr09g0399331 [Helianthus annuus]KAJ0894082.1 hypothetical protein HanPSC8_Chr09g0385111 [Helianthus annuus]
MTRIISGDQFRRRRWWCPRRDFRWFVFALLRIRVFGSSQLG